MPRTAATIAAVALRLWSRELARLLAVPVSRVAGALVAAGACAVIMGALLAFVASSNLPAELPVELRSAVLGTSFGGAALTAGAIGVALCAAAPPRTALENLLALLPVGPVAARLGQLLPTLALGLGYTLALSSTAAVVVVRTAPHPGETVLGLVAHVGVVVTALLVATGIFSLAETAAIRARTPHAYATALAGAAALAVTFASTLPDVLLPPPAPGADPGLSGLLPHRAFAAAAAAAPSALAWLTPLAWVAAAIALTVLAARVHRAGAPSRRVVVPRGTRPLRASPGWALLWLELLVIIRTPQLVLVAIVVPVAVAAVALLAGLPFAQPLVPSLAGAVVLIPALLGLHAPGRALPYDWVPDHVTARPVLRVLPQLAAVALVASALALPALGAMLVLGHVAPSAIGALALRGLLALALALACGAVVPWSEQQPLSASAGGLLLAVASVLLAFGISAASTVVGAGVEPALVALAALLAMSVYARARLRSAGSAGAA